MTPKKAKIFYIHPCDIRATRKEKFEFLHANKFKDIPFEQISPDKNNNWINLTDNDWDELTPLKNVFKLSCNSVKTNRDEWIYDFDKLNQIEKSKYFITAFNRQIKSEKFENDELDYSIKWSRDLKNKLKQKRYIEFSETKINKAQWRPFVKKNGYSEKVLNDVLTENHILMWGDFLNNQNYVINLSGTSAMRSFQVLSSNFISDYEFIEKNQCLPLYRYDKSGNRLDNITDWGLEQFVNHYKDLTGFENLSGLNKEAIFHYVYGVLHNPAYRKKYELNLKREFPRIPFYTNFWQWAAWGQELMELHINYETVEPFNLELIQLSPKLTKKQEKQIFEQQEKFIENLYVNDDFIPKAKLKADKENGIIILDELTTLSGIPKEAWEYKLGIRSALEWILDQYKERTASDPTIREKFNTYRFADYKDHVIDLLKRVCTVSVRTVEITKEMERETE